MPRYARLPAIWRLISAHSVPDSAAAHSSADGERSSCSLSGGLGDHFPAGASSVSCPLRLFCASARNMSLYLCMVRNRTMHRAQGSAGEPQSQARARCWFAHGSLLERSSVMRTLLVARVRPRLAALLLAAAGAFPACTPDSIPGESTARESSSPIASRLRGVRSSAMQCLDCGSGYCGDGFCDEAGGESCDFCPEDCGTCSPPPRLLRRATAPQGCGPAAAATVAPCARKRWRDSPATSRTILLAP